MRRILIGLAGMAVVVAALVGYVWVTTTTHATAGGGWRLVGAFRGGLPDLSFETPGRADLLTDGAALAAAWAEHDPATGVPGVDFEREWVIRATTFGSGSCPPHLDGVALREDLVVVGASRGFATSCSGDANPYTFFLVVERDRLPDPPFTVRVEADEFSADVEVTPG